MRTNNKRLTPSLVVMGLVMLACQGTSAPTTGAPTPTTGAPTETTAPPTGETTAEDTTGYAGIDQRLDGVSLRIATIGGGQYEEMYASIPVFEELTGATVEIVFLGDGFQIDRKLKQDFAAGTVDYDVAWDHTSFFSQYIDFLEPLDAYFSEEELADFTPRIIDAARKDGSLWLIPRHSDISVVHYRTDLWEDPANQAAFQEQFGYELQPPETWDQLYDMAEFFNDPPGLFGTEFAGKEEGLTGRYYEQLVANGGQFFDENWRPVFNDEIGVQTAEDFRAAYVSGIVPPDVTSLIWDGVAQNFCNGNIAIHNEWYGWYSFFQDPASCTVAGKFGLVRQPVGDGGVRSGWAGAHGFSIVGSSQQKEAAAALVKFLTSERVLYEEATLGFLPVRSSVWDQVIADAQAGDDPLAVTRLEIAQTQMEEDFFTPPLIAEWIPFSNIFFPTMQGIILGEVEVQQGLDQAAAETEQMLEEAGYYE